MTPSRTIHPVAKLFLDFAQAHPKVSFEIRQDGGALTPETPYEVSKPGAHLTPMQQAVMSRSGMLSGSELDQMLSPDAPKPVQKQQGVNIFSHDGATTHPDTWWAGRNGSLENPHQPIVQISALNIPKAGTKKLLGELNTMLKQKGLVGAFEQKAMNGFTQHEAPGVSLITQANSIILTVRTGDLAEPALTQ